MPDFDWSKLNATISFIYDEFKHKKSSSQKIPHLELYIVATIRGFHPRRGAKFARKNQHAVYKALSC
jgi:hypothetical protein